MVGRPRRCGRCVWPHGCGACRSRRPAGALLQQGPLRQAWTWSRAYPWARGGIYPQIGSGVPENKVRLRQRWGAPRMTSGAGPDIMTASPKGVSSGFSSLSRVRRPRDPCANRRRRAGARFRSRSDRLHARRLQAVQRVHTERGGDHHVPAVQARGAVAGLRKSLWTGPAAAQPSALTCPFPHLGHTARSA